MKNANTKSAIGVAIAYISIILCLIVSILLFSSISYAVAESSDFQYGKGTQSDPYLISNAQELNKVRYYRNAYFKQVTIYKERCAFHLSSIEEAESYIGKKVDIYIDGKGHSIAVYKAKKFNRNLAWTLMGLAIGIAVSYTVGLIIWGVWRHKQKYKNTAEDSDTVQV